MSLVTLQSNPAQQAALERQKRISSITSLVIALLTLGLLMLILAFVLLPSLRPEQVTVVAYANPDIEEPVLEKKKMTSVDQKPAPPSSSMAKVIAANTQSPTAIPVPEFNTDEVSLEFGSGNDFGAGWGDGSGNGGGGGATFFNQKVSAQRVAYVIDYSNSMGGEREKLMREELTKSVKQLTGGMQMQLIFFAGPSWVAGSEVSNSRNGSSVVKHEGRSYKWSGRGANEWKPDGLRQEAEWMDVSGSNLNKTLKNIKETKLLWGTDWEPALNMAMDMNPPPQVIFFMTDGTTGGDVEALAKKIGQAAKYRKIIVNTVALMEPRAEAGMKAIARETGGQFSIVEKGGKVKVVPVK